MAEQLKEHIKDPGSAITHFNRMLMAIFAAIPLLLKAAREPSKIYIIAIAVYAASLILLYAASTTYHTFDKSRKDGLLILKDKSVDWNKYLSPDTVTGGLGSQVFGPIISASKAVPVVMTRGASEVGFYVATGGQQALMMGFLVVDSSDAPASYGEAYHTIGTRDSITNTPINQPYLGSTAADIDADSDSDWTADDREDVADEGPAQLLTADQLSKTNDLLDLNKAKNGLTPLRLRLTLMVIPRPMSKPG